MLKALSQFFFDGCWKWSDCPFNVVFMSSGETISVSNLSKVVETSKIFLRESLGMTDLSILLQF